MMQRGCSRRGLLQRTGAAVALTMVAAMGKGAREMHDTVSAADEFDALRLRWRDLLTGGDGYDRSGPRVAAAIAALDSRAGGLWERMDKRPNRTALWNDLGPGTSGSSYITGSMNRLAEMARACATPGSRFAGDDGFLADTTGGLDFLNVHEYNETKKETGNWWDWEIGTPLALNNAAVLLYEHLSPDQIARYARAIEAFTAVSDYFNNSKTKSTGANRVWKAEVVAVRGVLVRDTAKLAHARDSLSEVFPFVTQGDGFYADGSFIQHDKHPYTGGYGTSLITELGNLLYLLSDSSYAVTDPALADVWTSIHAAFVPVIYRGAMMDMVRGREISRVGTQDHAAGHAAIRAVLTLAQIAPPADAATFKGRVKGWITHDLARDFLATAPLPAVLLAQAILNDPAIPASDELIGHHQFPNMDRVVHRRPGFALGIAMSSARIFTYESINGENLHAWHTGDGMTSLYTGDLTQFSDDFWPTVDPYRLPGATVDTRPRVEAEGQSKAPATEWVGGASLGEYGAVGMDLKPTGSDLVGRKSWFCLGDAIVCLGAGITSNANTPIETIIENRKLNDRGDNALTVDGAPADATLGASAPLDGATWLHLAGAGGYIVAGQPVQMLREARTGTWTDINTSTITPPVTRNYLTLWITHGPNPQGATYAYTLLPSASPDAAAAYAANPTAVVLANTPSVQAVATPPLRLLAANFWQPGQVDAGHDVPVAFARTDTPASILVRKDNGALHLAISDPTHTGTQITVELGRSASAILSADPTVNVTQLSPTVIAAVNVAGAMGTTYQVTLAV